MNSSLPLIAICLLLNPSSNWSQAGACPLLGPNLIINPGFEQGYFGFSSDFGRGINNATKGNCGTQGWIIVTETDLHVSPACQLYPADLSAQYGGPNTYTSSDPGHPSNTSVVTLATCNNPLPDHTPGGRFFLTIDPDDVVGRAYWKQTIRVCPNTDYVFSVWVRNVSPGCGLPAPFFHFEVGGLPINAPVSYPNCAWVNTAVNWNSGNLSGDVVIELINDLPGCDANDVAIDDLFFGICGGVFLTSDNRFAFCGDGWNGPVELSGSAVGFPAPQLQWQQFDPSSSAWIDIPGATDSVFTLPFVSPAETGLYRLIAANAGASFSPGCYTATGPVEVALHPVYHTQDSADICQIGPYAGYTAPGLYLDTLQSIQGCDSVRTLRLYRSDLHVFVPNAFSPNDDGVNDFFQPNFSVTGFRSYDFRVFDRWGSLVFRTKDPDTGWSGRHRGRDCETGVYVYLIDLETGFCGKQTWRGALVLVK